MSEKNEKKNNQETKAGLMNKNSGGKNNRQVEDAKDNKSHTENLPKVGKHKIEGSRESEGLH